MLIIASKPGQLGNMLLTFAHFIACAAEHRLEVANPAFDNYAEYFEPTSRDLLCRFPPKPSALPTDGGLRHLLFNAAHAAARALGKREAGVVDRDLGFVRVVALRDWTSEFKLDDPRFLASLTPRKPVLFRGWRFRCHDLVQKHAGLIRDYFRLVPRHRESIDRLIERARAGADVLVGVHIRQGIADFDNFRQFCYAAEQYADLMARVAALFPGRRVAFVVCSDKRQRPESFAGLPFVFGNDHVVEDMYTFARCDYIVGPPSTYTMWASFHGGVPLYIIEDPRRTPSLADFEVHVEREGHARIYEAPGAAGGGRQASAT